MKTLFITAALAITGLGAVGAAASAEPPGRIAPPTLVSPTLSGHCALRIEGGALVALAAPWNARDWSLSVRAPGLTADQGGDFYGDERRMERLSRIYLVDTTPATFRPGARVNPNDVLRRPLRAELTVTGHDGRTVCTDSLHLTPERGRGATGRPF